MKTKLLILLALFAVKTFAQNPVNIPDTNFKNALLAISGIDANNDTVIDDNEAAAYIGTINVSNKSIADLTGIEAFVNIPRLICDNNNLSNLNISANTSLTRLWCNNNNLSSLNVTTNTSLVSLECNNNNLTSLDVTQNLALESLACNNNVFINSTALNVALNIALIRLDVSNNSLTNLDVTNNINLTILTCTSSNLSSLDVTKNTLLEVLLCSNNNLTSLDLVDNTVLEQLICSGNNLTYLNLANGNNSAINIMFANGNVNLPCIQIDNGFTPPSNWQKHFNTSYSTDCSTLSTNNLEFTNFINIYPNPVTDMLNISTKNITEIKEIEVYNTIGKKVIATKNTFLNVSSLSKGVYFLKLRDINDLIATKKFVKK